jgi:hypothetical protein
LIGVELFYSKNFPSDALKESGAIIKVLQHDTLFNCNNVAILEILFDFVVCEVKLISKPDALKGKVQQEKGLVVLLLIRAMCNFKFAIMK